MDLQVHNQAPLVNKRTLANLKQSSTDNRSAINMLNFHKTVIAFSSIIKQTSIKP